MQKIYTPATKSIDPWNVDDNRGWEIIGGQSQVDERRIVPLLSMCIGKRSKSLADMPFSVYDQNKNVVDDSDDYKNVTGAIPNPYSFLLLTEMALMVSGRAYWGKLKNPAGYTKKLKYWAPSNVTAEIKDTTTEENLTFRRTGVSEPIPADKVFYIWLPDSEVEFGPPILWPTKLALKSSGALSSIDTFIDNYMSSGMVRAFIAQSETPPANEDEKKEVEDYLTRMLTGVRRALMKIRVLRKGMTISSIGGGLDELKNVGVMREIKTNVLEAFDTPASVIWSDSAANRATAVAQMVNYITTVVMPDARIIESALNTQIFAPYGYKFVFEPRRKEEFAELLGTKIESMSGMIAVLEPILGKAGALMAAIDLLGLELSPELIKKIETAAIEEARKPEPLPPPPAPVAPVQPEPEPAPEPEAQPMTPAQTKAIVELDKWQMKSEKAGKLVTWHAVSLDADIVEAVKSGTPWADAREMVTGKRPTKRDTASLLQGLEAAVKGLEIASEHKAAPMVVNLTAQMPQPGEPTITVNVPMQPAPVVTVNVPEMPTPTVTVTNEVQPAAVNVTNQVQPAEVRLLPGAKPKAVNIKRDNAGNITGAEME